MGDYPGAGSNMSNYGLKNPSPEEIHLLWREIVGRESRIRQGHLAINGDGSEQWPGIKDQEPTEEELKSDFTYFNNNKPSNPISTYDRLFHVKNELHSKLHRDDREHAIGLNVHAEETRKAVPALSSSWYGHRPSLETSSRAHVRIERVLKGFYRTRGTNIPGADT
ncbi:cilia- and flagella-associated protein 90-like [Saccoglossus kowalevskii]|uniref:Uncharacterized protein C5orf49 homolog n=1 Tax=Saccoglossus kowalevskii TaxID=10224 RepID=A0ABM0GWX0_SACKO|nr:PREDICTED: uncharacterized protein C5orf49 homolog [Saccoglossus kowalevskii]